MSTIVSTVGTDTTQLNAALSNTTVSAKERMAFIMLFLVAPDYNIVEQIAYNNVVHSRRHSRQRNIPLLVQMITLENADIIIVKDSGYLYILYDAVGMIRVQYEK